MLKSIIEFYFAGKECIFVKKPILKPFIKSFRKKTSLKPKVSRLASLPCRNDILCAVCAFLLSGTRLVGGCAPLGFAFSAAIFPLGRGGYISALFAILGLLVRGATLATAGKYAVAFLIYAFLWEKIFSGKSTAKAVRCTLAALSLFASGAFMLFAFSAMGGFPLIYDVIILITESATVYLGTLAFLVAVPIVTSLNFRRSLTAEETVSLAFLAGGVICGMGNIGANGIFTLSGVLCVFCVLAFASAFGAQQGCCAGIIMGLVSCLGRGRIDAAAASYALSGLCAGYFSKKGRWATCLSFIMTNAVITVLSNGSTEVLINLFDALIAAVILYCMPQKLYNAITNMGSFSRPEALLAAHNLSFAAQTIDKCEKSFGRISELRKETDANTLLLYRRSAGRVCAGCGLRKYCWGRDCEATKKALDLLREKMDNIQPVTEEDAPAHCLRAQQFTEGFARMYDLYKNDCRWTSRMAEMQLSVYEAFHGMSLLISKNADSLRNMTACDPLLSEEVKNALRRSGISASEVFVLSDGDDTTVHIKLESCGGFGRCENAVCDALSKTCGKSFVRTGLRCCGECSHTYIVKPSFSINAAVCGAIRANNSHSGDYAIYSLLDRRTYALILCDGMGSGAAAREESRLCASLIMRMLSSGLTPENALSIINAMFLCASNGTLAAIDLCLINLEDGSSRLYKFGGADTFLRIHGNVKCINTRTMPVGAAAAEGCTPFEIKSEKGDMIVLVSDGISSAEKKNGEWINAVIKEYDGSEPHTLAKMILERAKSKGANAADDITVVAAYIG